MAFKEITENDLTELGFKHHNIYCRCLKVKNLGNFYYYQKDKELMLGESRVHCPLIKINGLSHLKTILFVLGV